MENQDEYNEEVRREVVAGAFEPVLDEILDSQDMKAKYSQMTIQMVGLKFGLPFRQRN